MVRPIPSPDSDRDTSASPSEDVFYEVLSARRRRNVLHCLNEVEDGIGLGDLAERIALREADSNDGTGSAAGSRRIHLSLYHVHVPKLAAANAVEFDRAERTVSLTETGRTIAAESERFADRGE